MNAPPTLALFCTQCGGELHPDEGQIFLTCPYCSAAVFLDKSRVVFHWYLAPTIDEDKAHALLRGWMAGNQTVKDLDQKARILECTFEYFPIWHLKQHPKNGQEIVVIEPAAATSISELRQLNLPAGDLRKYDTSLDSLAHTPNVPLETALGWAAQEQLPGGEVKEQALVHIPLYTFKYEYRGRSYTSIVEAGTGKVFANLFPAKAETPYLAVGGLTAVVFLCLATFPLIGALADGGEGAGIGLALCAGAGIIAAPLLYALAVYVAAKI